MGAIKKAVPNTITSLGLIAGCISVVISVSYKDLTLAGYFILLASIFDFSDGFAARMLNAMSDFGKQLDSLSDVISFGVAPAMILFRLMEMTFVKTAPAADFDYVKPEIGEAVILYSTFLVAVFSALRLAKFNLDPEQSKSFKGLAVPANAIFFCGLGFIIESGEWTGLTELILSKGFLIAVTVLSCYLLVSNMPMFSLKLSSLNLRKNLVIYLFIAATVTILALFGFKALSFVIVLYVLMSVVNNYSGGNKVISM